MYFMNGMMGMCVLHDFSIMVPIRIAYILCTSCVFDVPYRK